MSADTIGNPWLKRLRAKIKHHYRVYLPLVCLWGTFSSMSYAYEGYLQLGAYGQLANAQRIANTVQSLSSYPVKVNPSKRSEKALYTVIIQGFKTKQQAQQLQSHLQTHGYKSLLKLSLSTALASKAGQLAYQPDIDQARQALSSAIQNPEYLLKHDLQMPIAPDGHANKPLFLPLREAIFLALRYSPDLQNSELNRVLQRYQLRIQQNKFELQYALSSTNTFGWAKSNGSFQHNQAYNVTPKVSLNSAWGTTSSVEMNNAYDGQNYSPTVSFNLSQPLLRGAGPTVAQQPLNDQYDRELINKLSLKQSVIDKVTAVISAYRSLIQQNNAYQTQLRSLKEAKRTLWVNKKRIEAGQLERTGNIQQSYQVANLSVTLESQRNNLVQARQALLQQIGLDPNLNIRVPDDVTLDKLEVPPLQETVHYALAHNTQYQNALIDYRITKRAYNVALNQQLWRLDLTAGYTLGGSNAGGGNQGLQNIFNGRNQSSTIGLQLDVPINDLNRRNTLISAKVALEQARLNLVAQRRALEMNVINRVMNIKTQLSLYKMSLRQQALAKQSYQIEIKKRQAGIATSLDVTNTQNQLIQAQNGLISAKIAYLEGLSQLYQLLGTTLDVWKIKMRFD